MNDDQLSRYSRHLLLSEIDTAGQETLLRSRALVVGLGGLGSPISMYLAASGVGTLVICDHDHVELSNLQRQLLHTTPDISRPKTESARDTLAALNPEIKLIALPRKLEAAELVNEVGQADVVIDASDNFATRYALNAACIAARKPLVSGSALRTQGQVTVLEPTNILRLVIIASTRTKATARKLRPKRRLRPAGRHHRQHQAAEALKILLGLNNSLWGRLLRVDARDMEFRSTRFKADPIARCARQHSNPRGA